MATALTITELVQVVSLTPQMEVAQELHVVGSGGHGRVVASAALALGWKVVAFWDDRESAIGTEVLGIPVRGPIAGLAEVCGYANFAVGNNLARMRWSEEFSHLEFPVVQHPFSFVDPNATIMEGTFVSAGAVVMVAAQVGRHCIVNTNSAVDHDVVVGDFVHVGPGVALAGGVKVGDRIHLDTGASVPYGKIVPSDTVVPAGSTFL